MHLSSKSRETMRDKLKRRFFRFHLSTAIVVMFVAAILLYLNLDAHPRSYASGFEISGDSYDPVFSKLWIRGWPFPCFNFVRSTYIGNTVVFGIPTPQGH